MLHNYLIKTVTGILLLYAHNLSPNPIFSIGFFFLVRECVQITLNPFQFLKIYIFMEAIILCLY